MVRPLGLSAHPFVPAQKSWLFEMPAQLHENDWSMHQRSPE
jgi:hypothetical protein